MSLRMDARVNPNDKRLITSTLTSHSLRFTKLSVLEPARSRLRGIVDRQGGEYVVDRRSSATMSETLSRRCGLDVQDMYNVDTVRL